MGNRVNYILLCLLLTLTVLSAEAKVKLPALVGDNMVLQQNTQVNLWGWADKGVQVTISPSWSTQKYSVVADNSGKWTVRVPTPGASAGHLITISDGQSITLKNILIGEVWICSGQSNMYMPMRGYTGQPVSNSMQDVISSGAYRDMIHSVTVPRLASDVVLDDFNAQWEVSYPDNTLLLSAAAYYFAKNIVDALAVPVGIISVSRGSSLIETWMDEKSVSAVAGTDVKALSDPKRDEFKRLGQYFNGMLSPVADYTARGFLWYQGESNVHNYGQYADLMQSMVALWRERWGDSKNDMPFYYVQVAPYNYKEVQVLPKLVEQQLEALKRIPNSGMIATTDIGMPNCIHPQNKEAVGMRLAAMALAKTYGMKKLLADGVAFDSVEYGNDGRVTVAMSGAPYGLAFEGDKIMGFEVAGEDKVFHKANATIVKSKPIVILTCAAVLRPVAVRYAFHNYPQANLCNTMGMPLFPMRTDRWDTVK